MLPLWEASVTVKINDDVCGFHPELHATLTKTVDKGPHYVGVASLSVFGGNFVFG